MSQLTFYFDYKSPYTYLAKDPAYELEAEFGVRVDWRPYTLDIPGAHGAVESRTELEWAKVKYMYMDVRRWANKRGLTVRGPQKIFDSSIAHIGMLYAQQLEGGFGPVCRGYHDRVFERFFKRELDIEQPELIAGVLTEAGADPAGFEGFLAGEGRSRHDALREEAEERGVFGAPTFFFQEEMFWGHDRIPLLRERLAAARPG